MENEKELYKELACLYEDLKAGKIQHKVAKQMNNTVSRIQRQLYLKMEYKKRRREKPYIPFMEDEK